MRSLLSLFLFLSLSFLSNQAIAQKSTSAKQEKAISTTVTSAQKQDLDTEESLKYMGSELFFQVKKRLHLTTEEEEKENEKQKGKKQVRFNILGIKIERG